MASRRKRKREKDDSFTDSRELILSVHTQPTRTHARTHARGVLGRTPLSRTGRRGQRRVGAAKSLNHPTGCWMIWVYILIYIFFSLRHAGWFERCFSSLGRLPLNKKRCNKPLLSHVTCISPLKTIHQLKSRNPESVVSISKILRCLFIYLFF